MVRDLWVEKYRPRKVDQYVFRDEKQKNQIKAWIDEKVIPHLLLSGTQGLGKTTLAKLLFHELEVPSGDILELNASDDNSVETIRNKVTNFVGTTPFSDFRYVLLDEADYLTPNAQAVLRGLMERYATTSRFILTCNYPNKILPALHSRCQGFHLTELDRVDFKIRAATVLASEDVEFDEDTLDTYIRATYPDMRKCLNMLQQNSSKNILYLPEENNSTTSDYHIKMVELFKNGKINEARKLICSQARPEEMEDIYRFLYQNIELWGDEQKQEQAILIIRDGLYRHAFVADPEINLSATLIELARLDG